MQWPFAVLLVSTAGCLALHEQTAEVSERASLDELRGRFVRMSATGFDGGLSADEVDVADALASGYSDGVRAQVIQVFAWAKLPMDAFEEAVLAIYNTSRALRSEAGQALVYRSSDRSADILADAIEEYPESWPKDWGGWMDCPLFQVNERLVDVLIRSSESDRYAVRAMSIMALGCSVNERAIPRLTELLGSPFWRLQLEAINALARMDRVPLPTLDALRNTASSHWSAMVRSAADALLLRLD